MRRLVLALVPVCLFATALAAQAEIPALEVKYVRDSEEYATIARQAYRTALAAATAGARALRKGQAWGVVLDVDETALDNSAYQLERYSYARPHDERDWNSYVARREAVAVPGVVDFVAGVRRLGGRVAWITNRDETTRDDTRANLAAVGLWSDGDRLCLLDPADTSYTKGRRRAEVASGRGRCGWEGDSVRVLAYLGDQLGDFPRSGEALPGAGDDAAFGSRFFLLPNPMYGGWTRRVTRQRP